MTGASHPAVAAGSRPGHSPGTPAAEPRARIGGASRTTDVQSLAPRPGQRLLTLAQAACYLGISPWTLRELVWKGRLPVVRLTRKLHFDLRDLDRFIEGAKETG